MHYINRTDGHHLIADLKQVHNFLYMKYNVEKEAQIDIERAKVMEKYLRTFKKLGNKNNIGNSKVVQTLEDQAMQDIAQEVGKKLKIGQKNGYSLFANAHSWYSDKQHLSEWQADDVFEAELAKLLQLAGEEALQKKGINLGASIIGKNEGNVSQEGLKYFSNLPDTIIKKTYKKIHKKGQNFFYKSSGKSQIITTPTLKAAKTDVTGYNADFLIEADIQPFWKNFIKTFTGAKFTVKNYSSTSKKEIIHLGNTNLYKAFYGTLTSVGIEPKSSAHVFYHTIHSKTLSKEGGEHVIHIRFAYELTGDGLYDNDSPPHKLDAADFFIYNDPSSDNIWVRSTKAMIAEVMNYIGNVPNPLHSDIVILKSSFK